MVKVLMVSFLLYKLLMIFRISSYSLYVCANTFLVVSLCWNKTTPNFKCIRDLRSFLNLITSSAELYVLNLMSIAVLDALMLLQDPSFITSQPTLEVFYTVLLQFGL